MTDKKYKHLWMVEDYPARGDKPAGSHWTKIGVAFENRDGSWSIDLKALPMNGKMQMRDPQPPRLPDGTRPQLEGRASFVPQLEGAAQ